MGWGGGENGEGTMERDNRIGRDDGMGRREQWEDGTMGWGGEGYLHTHSGSLVSLYASWSLRSWETLYSRVVEGQWKEVVWHTS